MKYNSKKSNVITFGKKTENMDNVFTYKLGDDPLNRVGVVKYFRILLSSDLKCNIKCIQRVNQVHTRKCPRKCENSCI